MNRNGVLNIVVARFSGQHTAAALQVVAQTAVQKGLAHRGEGFTGGTQGLGNPGVQFLRIAQKEGSPLFSPVVRPGDGDILLGLEAGHAARIAADYMGSHGTIIVNTWQFHPPYVPPPFTGYPKVQEVIELLRGLVAKVIAIDAVRLSSEAGGDGKIIGQGLVEHVMLGALMGSGLLPFSANDTEAVLAGLVAPQEQEKVVRAYRLGVRAASGVV